MKNALVYMVIGMCLLNTFALIYLDYKDHRQVAPQENISSPIFVPETKPEVIPEPPKPKSIDPVFVDVPLVSKRINEDSIYADIINHSRNPVLDDTRTTNAHETTHMITSDLRNAHRQSSGKKVNGFYVTQGKGVIVEEPKIRKSDMIPFVPQSLKSYRYSLYVAGSHTWDDTPTYIFDEWVAYVNGGMTGVDDVAKGKNREQTDAVSGCLDFSIYSVAICMATEAKDPQFFQSNDQFKRFVRWHLQRAYETYEAGAKLEPFKNAKQEELLVALRTSPDAQRMRDFITKHFDGIWLK